MVLGSCHWRGSDSNGQRECGDVAGVDEKEEKVVMCSRRLTVMGVMEEEEKEEEDEGEEQKKKKVLQGRCDAG